MGRPKSPLNDREYAPGQHGQRRKKPTDYGVQLMAKQKLKAITVILVKNNLKNTTQLQFVKKVTLVQI